MTTNIAKEKLQTLVDCAAKVATLYASGYATLHRSNDNHVTFVKNNDKCDGTSTVNAGLLSNAFIYSLMRRCSMERNMIGHTGFIYPGKGISKTYFLLARRKGSTALTQDVDELNAMANVYTEYPPVSLFYTMHKQCIPFYLQACAETSTSVFDPNTGAYVFRSRNKVINLIADLFEAAFSDKGVEGFCDYSPLIDDIISEVENTSTQEEDTSTKEKEKPAKEVKKAEVKTPANKKTKSKKATPKREEVIAAVEEAIADAEEKPAEEEEKAYALTEEEFISVFLSLEEEGKERWAKKLRPLMEEKKQPYIEQLKQIAQMQLDLEAQAKLVAEKVAKIDKIINRMASLFAE